MAALVIEYYFSLYLKAYTYQRIYIPLYVLFGHAVIYERLYTFTKKPIVLKYKSKLNVFLSIVIIALTTHSYVVKDDLFGFCLSVLFFVLVFLVKPARTYFLISYIVLAILELLGVYFKCWTWIDRGILVFLILYRVQIHL
ncbi:MAG: hypothetical protein HC798_02635 [Polaribacter sp.]|nr:hypothetical protein [Polaribacter sp.]